MSTFALYLIVMLDNIRWVLDHQVWQVTVTVIILSFIALVVSLGVAACNDNPSDKNVYEGGSKGKEDIIANSWGRIHPSPRD